MSIDEEIQKEYSKMKSDKIVDETITTNSKKQFADMILNSNIGYELKQCNSYYIQSKPLKLPFKIRLKNFIKRLKEVINGTE